MPPKIHTEDYYSTLGIHSSATREEITKAFRTLALKRHPDKNHEDGATGAFQLLNEAYEILKDSAQRSRYDAVDYPRIIKDSLSGVRRGSQVKKERKSQQSRFAKAEWYGQEKHQSSDFNQAPKRESKSRFGSASDYGEDSPTPKAGSKSRSRFEVPEHEPKCHKQSQYESPSEQAPNGEKQDFELGSKRYGNRARNLFFYLSAAMVKRGKQEVRFSEADDITSRNALQLAINTFAIELRRNTQTLLDDETIKAVWRRDPEGICFRQRERASYETRRKQYFINSFPELLKLDGSLPESWSYLWDAFSKEFSAKNQEFMDEESRKNDARMAEEERRRRDKEEANATQSRWRKERPEQPGGDGYVETPSRSGLPPRWPEVNWSIPAKSKMATPSNEKDKRNLAERAKARVLEATWKARWDRKRQTDDKKKRDADGDNTMGGI